jgi:hypothetical protein
VPDYLIKISLREVTEETAKDVAQAAHDEAIQRYASEEDFTIGIEVASGPQHTTGVEWEPA